MISFVLFYKPRSQVWILILISELVVNELFLNTAPSHWLFRGHMTSNMFPAESP